MPNLPHDPVFYNTLAAFAPTMTAPSFVNLVIVCCDSRGASLPLPSLPLATNPRTAIGERLASHLPVCLRVSVPIQFCPSCDVLC